MVTTDMLTNLTAVIISQHMGLSNPHVVHLELTQCNIPATPSSNIPSTTNSIVLLPILPRYLSIPGQLLLQGSQNEDIDWEVTSYRKNSGLIYFLISLSLGDFSTTLHNGDLSYFSVF